MCCSKDMNKYFVNKNVSYGPRQANLVLNHLCEQRRFRQACASAQSRQNLRCSLIQAASQAEPSNRKPDPWPLRMAGHAQLKFVTMACSKTQIRLTRQIYCYRWFVLPLLMMYSNTARLYPLIFLQCSGEERVLFCNNSLGRSMWCLLVPLGCTFWFLVTSVWSLFNLQQSRKNMSV